MAQTVKNLHAVQETRVRYLSQEDPLEKEMVTHSSILAWRLPWSLVKRSLVGYSPRDCKKSDMTEWLTHIAAEEGPSDSLDLRGHMPLCSLPLFIFLNIKFFLLSISTCKLLIVFKLKKISVFMAIYILQYREKSVDNRKNLPQLQNLILLSRGNLWPQLLVCACISFQRCSRPV